MTSSGDNLHISLPTPFQLGKRGDKDWNTQKLLTVTKISQAISLPAWRSLSSRVVLRRWTRPMSEEKSPKNCGWKRFLLPLAVITYLYIFIYCTHSLVIHMINPPLYFFKRPLALTVWSMDFVFGQLCKDIPGPIFKKNHLPWFKVGDLKWLISNGWSSIGEGLLSTHMMPLV